MLRVVEGGGREACSGVEGSESFFSRKFSESDWHLSISSPLSCRWRGEEEEMDKERMGKGTSVCGKMWGGGCGWRIKREMWNVRSAGFWGTPNIRSDSVSIWVSPFVSRIYITIPAWQQWSAVVTILEKASHPPRSHRGENHFRHQVEGVAMAPGKGAALDFTVRATLSLILITSSYAVAESKCSILFSKFEIYANLRIMKFDLGKVTFFENWNRFTKWKVNCVQDSCPFSAK